MMPCPECDGRGAWTQNGQNLTCGFCTASGEVDAVCDCCGEQEDCADPVIDYAATYSVEVRLCEVCYEENQKLHDKQQREATYEGWGDVGIDRAKGY